MNTNDFLFHPPIGPPQQNHVGRRPRPRNSTSTLNPNVRVANWMSQLPQHEGSHYHFEPLPLSAEYSFNRFNAIRDPYENFLESGECEDDSLFIDAAAIGHMTALVDGLRNEDGFLGSLSDWMSGALPRFPAQLGGTCDTTEDDLQRLTTELKDFKHIGLQFQKLSKCMEAIRIVAERRLEAARLRVGVSSLPNEILTNILLLATQQADDIGKGNIFRESQSFRRTFASSVRLSHVCDRFRRVILGTPEFWNGISDDMTQDMVKSAVIRSGQTPLNISLISFPIDTAGSAFYHPKYFTRLISKTSRRWKSLKICFQMVLGRFDDPGCSLKDLDLPSLTTLQVDRSLDTLGLGRLLQQHVLQGWSTPRLQHMSISQFVPPPLPHPGSSTLRCLWMDFGVGGRSTINIQDLRNFLLSCRSLSELQIRIIHAQFYNTTQDPSHFSLRSVETVSFEIPFCRIGQVRGLLEEIRFPAASKLKLDLGMDSHGGIDSVLSANMSPFFLDDLIFPSVNTLNLTVRCNGMYGAPGMTISIPFILLGNIRHLTLSIIGFGQLVPSYDFIPPLRCLRLQGCDSVDSSWIFDTIERLEQQGSLGELESLSIDDCGEHLNDMEVKCRSFPQGTLLEHLKAKLPAPRRIKKAASSTSGSHSEDPFSYFTGETEWIGPPMMEDTEIVWEGQW